jgi:hypothetical protein
MPLIYAELKKLANSHLARERSMHTLQPTALVHEAYLKLIGQEQPDYRSRAHFLGVVAVVMRQILIDRAREKRRKTGWRRAGFLTERIDGRDYGEAGEHDRRQRRASSAGATQSSEGQVDRNAVLRWADGGGIVTGAGSSGGESAELRIAQAWLQRELDHATRKKIAAILALAYLREQERFARRRREMNKYVLLGVVCFALEVHATLSFTGNLASSDATFEQIFTLATTTTIEIETFGFGGGTNASGRAIPAGGFDPLVALFSGTGAGATIVTDSIGNTIAGADTPSLFTPNCPPAHMVTIGTGAGSSICGDVFLQATNQAAGTYTPLLSDALYIPLAVDRGPPGTTLLSAGFNDFTGGVFQTCNTTSNGTTCDRPTSAYAVDLLGVSAPEPGTWWLAGFGVAMGAAGWRRKDARRQGRKIGSGRDGRGPLSISRGDLVSKLARGRDSVSVPTPARASRA